MLSKEILVNILRIILNYVVMTTTNDYQIDAVIELYANCNPLTPNAFLCVESSRQYCGSATYYRTKVLPLSKEKLKAAGLQFYTVTKTESISTKE